MRYAVLYKFYIYKYFAGMLNSRQFEFANIMENKVIANNIELIAVAKLVKLTVFLNTIPQSQAKFKQASFS